MNNLIKTCKNHPNWLKLFKDIIDSNENIDIKAINDAFNLYIKEKNILKKEVTIEIARKMHKENKEKFPELFFDEIEKVIFKKKKNNFIKSLKTKKYIHLFNSDTEKQIDIILKNKISIKLMKSQFFNKIGAYKTSDGLLTDLILFKNKNITWNIKYYKKLINSLNAKIIEEKENYIIVQTNDYEACKALGSQSWCITRRDSTYNQYTSRLKRQMIILDFNLPIEDTESIIGVTIDVNGIIKHSHLKNDFSTPNELLKRFKFEKLNDEDIKKELLKTDAEDAFCFIMEHKKYTMMCEYIEKGVVDINVSVAYQSVTNKPLKWAVENNKIDIIIKILQHQSFKPSRGNDEFQLSMELGNKEIMEILIKDKSYNNNVDSNHSLIRASTKGYFGIVEMLLTNELNDLKKLNDGAIRGALHYKNIDIVKLLIKDEHYYKGLGQKLKSEVDGLIHTAR